MDLGSQKCSQSEIFWTSGFQSENCQHEIHLVDRDWYVDNLVGESDYCYDTFFTTYSPKQNSFFSALKQMALQVFFSYHLMLQRVSNPR